MRGIVARLKTCTFQGFYRSNGFNAKADTRSECHGTGCNGSPVITVDANVVVILAEVS